MLRRAVRALSILSWLVALVAAPASASHTEALAPFVGRYEHVGGARDARALEAAIERVVTRMGFLVQGIARQEIRRSLRPEERVAVDLPAHGLVRITLGRWRSPPLSADGRAATVRGPDGAVTRLSVRHRDGVLYTRAETDRGTRESWLRLSPDGTTLRVQVRVRSAQLPEPIEYELAFRRAP